MSQIHSVDVEAIARLVAGLLTGMGVSGVKSSEGFVGKSGGENPGVSVVKSSEESMGKSGGEKLGVSGVGQVDGGEVVSGSTLNSKPSPESLAIESLVYDRMASDGAFNWADDVAERESGSQASVSSLDMPAGVTHSDKVKKIRFGGVADVVGVPDTCLQNERFYASYVRTRNVLAFRDLLREKCKVVLPKAALEELALAMHTTATVPSVFVKGAVRLRSLAAVGDAMLSFLLVARMHANSETVSSVQAAKSSKLNNAVMSRKFARSRFSSFVSYPAGVDAESSKLGADVLEALVGVIANHCDMSAAVRFANYLQLF